MNRLVHQQARECIAPFREALYNLNADTACNHLVDISNRDTLFKMCHPFGEYADAKEFFTEVFHPLICAWPDLERRDYIIVAGHDEHNKLWVGCGGYYTGTFLAPWLAIAPTGHQVHMRFHEFYCIDQQTLVEFQAIWDIPEVMLQANAWPLTPSLGREWHVPAPATQDGLNPGGDAKQALATRTHIINMLDALKRHPRQGPETMEMERYWHINMNWYGPSGIGTARGIAGFRHWHQIPFLRAMPDRGQYLDEITYHFFAQGQYAAVTGWPNMIQTITHDGWLGIAPTNTRISMRSLDFWRLENGKIRENWVLVDLLDMYCQIGIDVFARLADFNKARTLAPIHFRKDY